MKNNKIAIFKYFIEFLIVAFGVFLGTYISGIQSDKKLNKEKVRAMNFIIEELQTNLENIRKAAKYHHSLAPVIDSIRESVSEKNAMQLYIGNKNFQHNKIPGWKGINLPELDHTAFESARLSGILTEFDIETIRTISRIYNWMDIYSDFGNKVLNKMIDTDSQTKVIDVLIILDVMTKDIVQFEDSLEKGLTDTITELEKTRN